jgi:hypothetical protein
LEEDVIPTGRVVVALVATIVLTVVSLVWVSLVMKPLERADRGTAAPSPLSAEGGPPAVDRTLYDRGPGYASALTASKRALLETWGWVDPKRRLVRIPIDRAMRAVVIANGEAAK